MSWAASAWAKQAGRAAGKALNPALRYLLVCVADRTNDDTGYTYASPRCLSEDVGNSVDSIKDGLRRLEAMGYLARVRRMKANGSHDTSLIILLVDDEARAKAAQLHWTKPAEGGADDGEDAAGAPDDQPQDVEGWGENHPHPGSTGVGGNGPPGWGENDPTHIDEPEKGTLNPPTPSRVREPAEPSAEPRLGMVPSVEPARALPDGYDPDVAGANAFLETWRSTVRASVADVPEEIRRIWRKLSVDERRKASAEFEAWRRQMDREKRPFGSATKYLRDKAWEAMDHVRAGRREGTAVPSFFVHEGSDAWRAWVEHRRRAEDRATGYPTTTKDGRRGWYFPSPFPPRSAAPAAGAKAEDDPAEVARMLAGG
jgi:hypothetical protein